MEGHGKTTIFVDETLAYQAFSESSTVKHEILKVLENHGENYKATYCSVVRPEHSFISTTKQYKVSATTILPKRF